MRHVRSRVPLGLMVILMILAITPTFAASDVIYPKPATVSDYTGTLTQEERSALTAKLESFRQETSNEIALLIVNTTEPETIEQYSIHVAEQWKIGKKNIDNGILFTVAIQDHKMRIEVGKGLEGVLPDLLSTKILATYTTPEFKAGNYYKGIDDTLNVIMSAAKSEFNTQELLKNNTSSEISENGISFIIWIIFVFGFSFIRYMASTKSWWQGGVMGGGLALILSLVFTFSLIAIISATVGFALLGLITDFFLSKYADKINRGGKSGGFGGFFFGGRSGGGSSGGGFSGFSGGGFSGGGGSGSW